MGKTRLAPNDTTMSKDKLARELEAFVKDLDFDLILESLEHSQRFIQDHTHHPSLEFKTERVRQTVRQIRAIRSLEAKLRHARRPPL